MRHATLDDPRLIAIYRMATLRHALKLELKGMKRRGRSAYSIIKQEFKLTGNRQSVYDQFTEMCKIVLEQENENELSH